MKFLLIIFTLLLFSCTPKMIAIDHFSERQTSVIIDFSDFSKKGFLFTPHGYTPGQYASIGIVSFNIRAQAEFIKYDPGHPFYNSLWPNRGRWQFSKLSTEKILSLAYEEATLMGADAIIDFKISIDEEEVSYSSMGQTVNIPVLNVSGFAIKRKNQ